MSQDTEKFDSLRRLLAIKRHEVPPPGYFEHFSSEVLVRIRAGDRGEEAHGYVWQMGWLHHLWSIFEAKPALAGGLGLALCGLMIFGVVSADSSQTNLQAVSGLTAEPQVHTGLEVANNLSSDQPVSAQSLGMEGSSRGSIRAVMASTDVQPSLFDLNAAPQVQVTPVQLQLAPQ